MEKPLMRSLKDSRSGISQTTVCLFVHSFFHVVSNSLHIPWAEALQEDQNQQDVPGVNGKEPEQQAVSENAVPNVPSTVETVETAKEQEDTSKTANCTFSGVVRIDLRRFTDSGISLVECPDCGRMRSLSPVKGVLRFKAHTPRKQQTPQTSKRWSATGKTDWEVVGGESAETATDRRKA